VLGGRRPIALGAWRDDDLRAVPFPTFLIGPAASWARDAHQSRRKVKLTVHRAQEVYVVGVTGAGVVEGGAENYYITVTNASRDRDIVVTHIWLETTPRIEVFDPDLPVRLRYGAPWETTVSVDAIPEGTTDVEWLARAVITPDDKVIKSRPRRNVPPFGTVPRG
jgi:hypothetical protein